MPPATRSRTAADATRDEATGAGASPDGAPAPENTTLVRADAGTGPPAATEPTAAAGTRTPDTADLLRTIGRVATLPVTVVKAVADDVASTARRPDAVLYWGGLAGLAALGLLEWPVVAAVAVGVVVANGRRRPRPHQSTSQPTP